MTYRRVEQRRTVRRERSGGARPPSRVGARPTPEGGQRQAWTRIGRSRTDAIATRLSSPVAGALAGGWSAGITLLAVGLLVLIAWILGTGAGGISGALQIAGIGWLATHHVPILIDGGSVSALPLGFVVIPGYVLWRAGCWATRRSGACRWQEIRTMTFFAAAIYGSIALLIASASSTDSTSAGPLFALFGVGCFAAIGIGAGASFEAGLWHMLVERFSPQMRHRLQAAATGFATLVAGAAVLLAVSMFLHFGTALDMTGVLVPGLLGSPMLLILGIAFIPNAIIWSIGYVCGPGFAVGQATVVSPFGVQAGALPGFPLLAGIPESAALWAPVVLLIPLFAGAVATLVANRATPGRLVDRTALRERVIICGLIAIAVWVVCMFGSGSFGAGRLSEVGPVSWEVGIAAFALLFVGGWLADLGQLVVGRFVGGKKAIVDLTDASS